MASSWSDVARNLGSGKFNDKHAHRFFDFYERELEGFHPGAIIEIGVQAGISLRFWREVFPQASIVGVDIKETNIEGFDTVVADQTKLGAMDWADAADMIVDDGGHSMRGQIVTFNALWPKVNPGGVYVIEDLHTCWMPGYSDDEYEPAATMKMIQGLVSDIHPASGGDARSIKNISIYPSIAFFWKEGQ